MTTGTIEDINARLKEILELVDDPNLPMDEILSLYEEAVRLGAQVGDAIEANISDEAARAAAAGVVDAAAADVTEAAADIVEAAEAAGQASLEAVPAGE